MCRVLCVLFLAVPLRLLSQDASSHIRALLAEGEASRKKGDVKQALQNYFDALRTAEESQHAQLTAITAHRVGDLYERYYRYQESVPFLKKAYSLIKQTDSVAYLAQLSNSIAWNFTKSGLPDSALAYSEESVRLYQTLSNTSAVTRCVALESLGEIYSMKKRYSDASRVLDECMRVAQQADHEVAIGFTHYGLAFNEFNQQHYQKAKGHINACLPVAEKYAAQQLLADVYHLAYQVHQKLGEAAIAYPLLQKYATLKDKIHSEDIEKKASIINANYEIQKKEADLQILTQLNSIQQLEIERSVLVRNFVIAGLVLFILIAVLVYHRIRTQRRFEQLELQRKKEELDQARRVQLSLLPQKPMINAVAEVQGKMVTATEVGGDYYDYFQLDDHRVLIAFGDATGHGMTAGLIVTIAKVALINNLAGLKSSNDLVSVIRSVNDSILSSISVKGMGLALQLCLIDSEKKLLTYTSCGMPYPMVYNFGQSRLSTLEMRQPPLGFFRQMKIEQKEVSFEKNHLLLLSSDGIFERFNLKKEEYGFERFGRIVENHLQASTDLQQLLESIFTDTEHFSDATPNHDDMTALCARLG